jgi:hypothetical protein
MLGTAGQVIRFAAMGSPTAQEVVRKVFGPDFQTPQSWTTFLGRYIPALDVDRLLNRTSGFWERENFQALYIVCWIFHPVEKGSYMIQLSPAQHANVQGAFTQLIQSGGLQARISSHLSKQGASAHEGWGFLQGYHELLIQIEGANAGSPYLFLKCEGHALDGIKSTFMHGKSWVTKTLTGAGDTASPALNNLAKNSTTVELRAAENFGKSFKKVQKKLGLSGKEVTIAEVVNGLWQKCGFRTGLPAQVTANTHALGNAMLGGQGIIAVLRKEKAALKKHGIDFDAKLEQELTELAERMKATAVAHPMQHYHEVRMTPLELTQSLAVFTDLVM